MPYVSFQNVKWLPGILKAVALNNVTVECQYQLVTATAPRSVKLTLIAGPGGLRADGEDVVLYNVEVVDAQGCRCPTDQGRINFKVSGPCVWRGGYDSGIVGSTNNLYLYTECGINRVAIRSTLTPGQIKLTASRPGLKPVTVTVESKPIARSILAIDLR